MLVKDLPLAEPIICTIDDNLSEIARKMAENDLVCVPVVESLTHKSLLGAITDKDICRRAVANGLDPAKTKAGRVMSIRFFTVAADAEIEECYRKLKDSGLEYLFVTDENNSCLGVLTEKDLSGTGDRLHKPVQDFQYVRNDRIF
jgi:CBS domain-containing protein